MIDIHPRTVNACPHLAFLYVQLCFTAIMFRFGRWRSPWLLSVYLFAPRAEGDWWRLTRFDVRFVRRSHE